MIGDLAILFGALWASAALLLWLNIKSTSETARVATYAMAWGFLIGMTVVLIRLWTEIF